MIYCNLSRSLRSFNWRQVLGPTIYLHGIGPPEPRSAPWQFAISTDNAWSICDVSHNTPVMCHKYACKKQQHREQYFMDRQLPCGQFSKFGGNMHSSEFYISLNSRTPLALLLFQNGEKEVIVNQIIIFNLSFLSFLIQHSTSLWRSRIWQAQLFHRPHPHQQHSSDKKQFQHNHRCAQGLTRFGTRDTCRPMRLAQPAWHSVV